MLAPARSQHRTRTLSQVAFPQQTLVRNVLLVVAASMFIAASARVSILLPIGPVPITAQTFAVLLVGGTLGARLGFAAAALYVAEGVLGLPVFASGRSGWAVIIGSSGGYLVAYPFSTALVGWLAERGWDRRPTSMATAMLLGSAVIYAIGLPWLYAWAALNPDLSKVDPMTIGLTLKWGLIPFIPGDLAKLLLAAGLVPSVWQLLRAVGIEPSSDTREMPRGNRAAPLAAAAASAMAAGAVLSWSPGVIGLATVAGLVAFAAGALGLVGAVLRMRGMLSAGGAQLWGFTAAAAGGLAAFINLVVFTKAGELALADIGVGVVVTVVASLVLLASTAMEAAAE